MDSLVSIIFRMSSCEHKSHGHQWSVHFPFAAPQNNVLAMFKDIKFCAGWLEAFLANGLEST